MVKERGIQRKRIIIYYVIAIVFPSIILGILAYRGVKNDQALVEREQRRTYQESGQIINDDIDAYLKSIENSFTEIIDSARVPEEIVFSDSALTSMITFFPVAEGAFYLSGGNDVSVLNNYFLYEPDHFAGSKPGNISGQVETILRKGWDLEFRKKEYSKAIDYYKTTLPLVTSMQGQAEIYNSIARIQKKLGRLNDALKTYDTLLTSYADVYIQGNIPLGMVALLESGLLYLDIQDTARCLEITNTLLVQIKDSRWSINYPTYFNVVSKVKEIIALGEGAGGESNALIQESGILLDRISALENRTEYLLAVADLTSDIQSIQSSIPDNSTNRYVFNQDGKSYFVFLSPLEEDGQWGLIYNQEYILQNIVNTSIQEIADDSDFDWEIVNNYGKVLIHSGSITAGVNPLKILFSASFPSWTLLIYPKSRGIFVSMIQSGEGIFFYIFLFIVIIMACGLFFTLFTINNEMRLMKMKSNFITTVSHEFKSPLTLIRQIAEMLESGRVPDKERQKKYYSAMLQESERLSYLIDNILDFSKMEAGLKQFNFEKGNLAGVVEEIVISCQTLLMDKGFQINLMAPDSIPDSVFDREAIKQVFQNLIDNASKYSGDSKIIEVNLSQIDLEIIIDVKDFGIGIHKDEQDKIFSRFYRAGDELTQKVKGSGIGLTIVKQIVNAHRGTIALKSEPGKGSVFQVVLPLKNN